MWFEFKAFMTVSSAIDSNPFEQSLSISSMLCLFSCVLTRRDIRGCDHCALSCARAAFQRDYPPRTPAP